MTLSQVAVDVSVVVRQRRQTHEDGVRHGDGLGAALLTVSRNITVALAPLWEVLKEVTLAMMVPSPVQDL